MIHDPALETLERERLRELQSGRLRAVARYAYERIGLYRERFDQAGLRPDEIRSLDDLRRLPFTRKSDLRDHYPFGLFAVPREEIVRIHGSSGTTGKPTVVGYTRADVELFAEVNARSLAMAGAEPGMMLHNAYGYGLFTGGLGLHYGGERLGLSVVPVSGGMTERQLLLIADFRPDVIACTPSYALTLAQAFRERGVGPDEISLRYAIVGARALERDDAQPRSTAASASRRATSTGCPRSSALASRASASRSAAARTSTRITSSPRSSIPRAASSCRRARSACSSSPRSPSRRCRSCATGRATSRASRPSRVVAAAPSSA